VLLPPEGNGPYRLLRALSGSAVRAFHASADDPAATQQARLDLLSREIAPSAHGRHLGVRAGMTLADWKTLPIASSQDAMPWLERVAEGEPAVMTRAPVRMLVETSGTTGTPKRLPVTDAWSASVAAAQRLWALALLKDDEGLAKGKALSIASPAEHARSPGGIAVGSNTGRMLAAQPWWIRRVQAVPGRAYATLDAEVRAYAILRHALAADVVSWTAANPSTFLLYRRRLAAWWEDLSRDCADGTCARTGERGLSRRRLGSAPAFPWALRRLGCWTGGTASFFLPLVREALGDIPLREVGITASEGFFAVPLDDGDPIAWLAGHVLEFMDEGGACRWAWEVETGREYRLVISTEAGLVRHDLADVVQVTGWAGKLPRLRFLRRAGGVISATGEKLTELQIADAVRACAPAAMHASATAAMAEVPWIKIAIAGVADDPTLGPALDAALRRANPDYAGKRESGRMATVEVVPVAAERFVAWRAARVAAGAPDAQVKDPWTLDAARWADLVGR
jgi:hypothetical protein